MALAVVVIAIALAVVSFRNTQAQFGVQLAQDIVGFWKWLVAILMIGALGIVPGMRGISRGLLILVLVVLILTNQGAFHNFAEAVQHPPMTAKPPAPQLTAVPTVNLAQSGKDQGGGGGAGDAIATAAKVAAAFLI